MDNWYIDYPWNSIEKDMTINITNWGDIFHYSTENTDHNQDDTIYMGVDIFSTALVH